MKKRNIKLKKKTNHSKNTIIIFVKTAIWELVLFCILLSIASAIICSTDMNRNNLVYIAQFITILSSFAGGFYAARKCVKRGLLHGALSQPMTFLLIFFISVLCNGGIGIGCILTFFIMLIFGAFGGLVAINLFH